LAPSAWFEPLPSDPDLPPLSPDFLAPPSPLVSPEASPFVVVSPFDDIAEDVLESVVSVDDLVVASVAD
jgi:hypothetical protein